MEKKERPKEFKDFRCKGKNKKERECGVLLFRYKITDEEMIIQSNTTFSLFFIFSLAKKVFKLFGSLFFFHNIILLYFKL